MVEPICYKSNWFQLIGLIEVRYEDEEYCWKSKSLFALVVGFDLRFRPEVFPGWHSDRMKYSQKCAVG